MFSKLPTWALVIISITAQSLKALFPEYGLILEAIGVTSTTSLAFTPSVLGKK